MNKEIYMDSFKHVLRLTTYKFLGLMLIFLTTYHSYILLLYAETSISGINIYGEGEIMTTLLSKLLKFLDSPSITLTGTRRNK